MAQAVLTAASKTTKHERHEVIELLRYSPSAQMIGQSWRGARLLIEADDDMIEATVAMIRKFVAPYIRYRRDA